MNSVTATASVSDSNGLVLFYSNGNYVFDRNHGIMSTLVWGMNSNQPVFAFKKIGENDRYWIFSLQDPLGFPPQPQGLYYSVIDMTLNGGLGSVISSQHNIPVPGAEFAFDKLTGIRHHNNRDAWIVTRDSTQHFLSYLVSSSGISGPVISSSSAGISTYIRGGDIKISPDGKKLVSNYASGFNYNWSQAGTEYCSFDSKTGLIVPLFWFKPVIGPFDTCAPHWAEFSPNSKLLYIGCHIAIPPNISKFGIFQYDATRNDSAGFMNSQVFLGYTDGPGGVRALQMAPDGKIYSCFSSSDNLCVINYPNVPGTGCGFQIIGLNLNGKICYEGLPQFLQKYKAYIHGSDVACQEDLVNFSSDIWPPPDTIRWDFGDPASGNKNTSELASPGHTYALPGTYTVQLYVRHNDNRTDTTWKTLTINPKPSPALGGDRVICEGAGTTFNAGACSGCSYVWGNLTTGQPNIGTNQTYSTGQPGVYMVTVTSNLGCIGRDTIQLSTAPPPVSTTTPTSKPICSGEMTAISPTSVPASTIYTWVPSLTSGNITGFSADSGLVINQTLINNGATAGVVTYHITPKIGDCAGTPVDYVVTVNPGIPVGVTIVTTVTSVCEGASVTFTAVATNQGITPVYQWHVNTANAGLNSPTFTFTPVNGDIVKCILTSSNTVCTSNNPDTSNAITLVVNPEAQAGIAVLPSINPVCAGTPVTFTAAPVNGGSAPQYQWKVNGISVGSNSSTFSYTPSNGDSIRCILTSNLSCVTGNPVSSAKIIMNNLPVPFVTFIPCFDTITTLNAKPFHLKGGLPLCGTYSGPGVDAATGMLTPSLAGTGTKILSYSYTNTYTCNSIAHCSLLIVHSPFTCGSPFSDPRDGKSYQTLLIATHCWMSENLDFRFQISDLLPPTDNCIPKNIWQVAVGRCPRPYPLNLPTPVQAEPKFKIQNSIVLMFNYSIFLIQNLKREI